MIRASGNPVSVEQRDAKEAEFKEVYDGLIRDLGKFGPEIQAALEDLDRHLEKKYNDLTVKKVQLPKTKKAWIELMNEYGNIMITTCVEGNEFASSGDLLLVINDIVY